jgi:hypothetical protein
MEIPICRKTKKEAARAMFYLVSNGWEITHPLTEVKTSKTERGAYNYQKNRYDMSKASSSSVWMAKLKREDKNNKHDKEVTE